MTISNSDAPRAADHVCEHCGDQAQGVVDNRWVCLDCWRELVYGVIPPYQEIASGKIRTHQPGTGEGNDFFGNHT